MYLSVCLYICLASLYHVFRCLFVQLFIYLQRNIGQHEGAVPQSVTSDIEVGITKVHLVVVLGGTVTM